MDLVVQWDVVGGALVRLVQKTNHIVVVLNGVQHVMVIKEYVGVNKIIKIKIIWQL
jgi:hypothetical protein